MSDVRWNDTLFDTTDIATAAPKRSVCPTAHPAMNPPYDRPAIPSRSGSATPSAMHASTPDITSWKSTPPESPITSCANP